MISERYIPLAKAAKILGIHRQTLRKRLEKDCGLVFGRMGRGVSPLVSERDIQFLIEKYTGQRNWSRKSRVA